MVLITKHAVKDKFFFQVRTSDRLLYLDFPAPIYGKNLMLPSFTLPPRPLSFSLYRSSLPPDALFVTNSSIGSFGCLFLGKVFNEDIPIYCTPPVYEQLIMRYEEYAFSQVAYSDEQDTAGDLDVFTIDQADIKYFKRNVVLVQFGEAIPCGLLTLTQKPAGTFIGWSYIHIACGSSISYITSYATRKRISLEAAPIESDFLLINLYLKHQNSSQGITEFNNIILSSKTSIVISVAFETLFVEILLHVFSLLRTNPVLVYAVSPVVHKLEQLVVNQGEWLNSKLSCDSESTTLSDYPLFKMVETMGDIESSHKSQRTVIFYNDLILPTISRSQKSITFSVFTATSGDVIDLKMDMSEEEIVNHFISARKHQKAVHSSVITTFPFILKDSVKSIYFPLNINVFDNTIFANGILNNTDKETPGQIQMSFDEKQHPVKTALASANRIISDNEWFVIPESKIKFRIIGNCIIEYKKIQ